MANYLFKNPRRGRRMPPKEWFYYMYERVLKRLKATDFRPRPGSPYRTPRAVAKAIAGGMWWGTFDGMKPETKQRVLTEIIKKRAAGKVTVVTGRKGAIAKRDVISAIGKAKADALYKKLALTSTEIKEARALMRERVAMRRPIVELREVASNPELMMVFGNPGASVMADRKRPPTPQEIRAMPEFKAAVRKYKEFHGEKPGKMTLQWVEAENIPPVLAVMGEAPEAVYHVKGTSKKQKRVPFKHDFKGKMLMATDGKGKAIFLIPDAKKGKGIKVTDWIRG